MGLSPPEKCGTPQRPRQNRHRLWRQEQQALAETYHKSTLARQETSNQPLTVDEPDVIAEFAKSSIGKNYGSTYSRSSIA
ncbi:hypothetical protein SK128_027404 [Halocaridina rubra]|uniref:Uncharacterized protein n=1 Tax=Halocaridina rubra TaxID=373956 RepID=A0AAN8XWV2_HALRR